MNFTSRLAVLSMLGAAIFFVGCHGNQQPASNEETQQNQPSSDPASANLAPVADTSGPVNASAYGGEYSDQSDDSADESYYGVEPAATAPDPPPPLPEYDQPPCPGDGYLWTPGYWDYASTGYYWVPGVWVQQPYVGALWTPGYWAYSHGHYAFFSGYWGPHIGFYGGVNYGYGYTGEGYEGGYWNSGQFYLNRAVNNINVAVVHHVYSRTVVNMRNTTNHVSYNGGSGGIDARPQAAELAALREPHAAPMQTQVQVERNASRNRQQFASVNHGRPAEAAATHPVAAQANVRPVASTHVRNLPMSARPPAVAHNNSAPANRPAENTREPNRTAAAPERPNAPKAAAHAHPELARRQAPPANVASRPRPEPSRTQKTEPSRPAPAHPAPQQSHAAQPANRAAPQQNRAARPASHPSSPQNRAAEPANHPQPERKPPAPDHKNDRPGQ